MGNVQHPSLGFVNSWEITALKGRSFILEKGGNVWVDTSATGGADAYLDPTRRSPSGAGPAVYQIAQAYAANTGKKFIPDPEGVSEIAKPRRWAHMLSSALRFNSSAHLDPWDSKDNAPEIPGWHDGDPAETNIGKLAMAEYSYVKSWFPEIDSLHISPDFTTLLDADGNSLGNDPARAFESLLTGRRDPGATGIGETTLLRTIVTRMATTGTAPTARRTDQNLLDDDRQSLQRADSGRADDSGVLRGIRGRGDTADSRSGDNLRRDLATSILYSPAASPNPDNQAAADAALANLAPIFKDVLRASMATPTPTPAQLAKQFNLSERAIQNISSKY
jgi:hypothetical protein